MSQIAKPIVWTASLALLAGVAQAAVTEIKDQPYKVILTRNAFGLKPPPPPEEIKTETGPPPNVKLTGIIAITEPKKAMFVVTPSGKGEFAFLQVKPRVRQLVKIADVIVVQMRQNHIGHSIGVDIEHSQAVDRTAEEGALPTCRGFCGKAGID